MELLVVIIILGILSTLALTQYGRVIERTRGAEARAVLGLIRLQAAAYRLELGTITGFLDENGGIGTSLDQAPILCAPSHYFSYSTNVSEPAITITATRCEVGGKTPQGPLDGPWTLTLTSNLVTGEDTWSGTGYY